MPLTSFTFFGFFILTCILYFSIPKKFRWIVLLIGSYIFYCYAGVKLVFYLLFSTASAYLGARMLGKKVRQYKAALPNLTNAEEKAAFKARNTKQKKRIIALVLVANFAVLVFFKHFDAWIDYINILLGLAGHANRLNSLELILPLGISFYTFQAMGYLIDVYRGKFEPDKNIAKFALFVSFFPQLIQGPISRYDELAFQLYEGHSFDFTRVKHGIMLMFWGLFKKLVIGDRINMIVSTIFDSPGTYTGAYALLGAVAYSIQIYADFSGGVDIARGAAQVLGIELPENFLRPYFAETLPDFWRRWHVTLNNWWRDYIFYPLTFSKQFVKFGKFCRKTFNPKVGKILPIYLATMLVRVINGLWHGASIKYIVFGVYHGILIILGMQLEPFFAKIAKRFNINTKCFSWKLFGIIRTFAIVVIGRIITRPQSFRGSLTMFGNIPNMFQPNGNGIGILFDGSLLKLGLTGNALFVLFLALLVLFYVDLKNERNICLREVLERQNIVFQWMVWLGLIVAVAVFGVYGPNYSSTTFIYQQF